MISSLPPPTITTFDLVSSLFDNPLVWPVKTTNLLSHRNPSDVVDSFIHFISSSVVIQGTLLQCIERALRDGLLRPDLFLLRFLPHVDPSNSLAFATSLSLVKTAFSMGGLSLYTHRVDHHHHHHHSTSKRRRTETSPSTAKYLSCHLARHLLSYLQHISKSITDGDASTHSRDVHERVEASAYVGVQYANLHLVNEMLGRIIRQARVDILALTHPDAAAEWRSTLDDYSKALDDRRILPQPLPHTKDVRRSITTTTTTMDEIVMSSRTMGCTIGWLGLLGLIQHQMDHHHHHHHHHHHLEKATSQWDTLRHSRNVSWGDFITMLLVLVIPRAGGDSPRALHYALYSLPRLFAYASTRYWGDGSLLDALVACCAWPRVRNAMVPNAYEATSSSSSILTTIVSMCIHTGCLEREKAMECFPHIPVVPVVPVVPMASSSSSTTIDAMLHACRTGAPAENEYSPERLLSMIHSDWIQQVEVIQRLAHTLKALCSSPSTTTSCCWWIGGRILGCLKSRQSLMSILLSGCAEDFADIGVHQCFLLGSGGGGASTTTSTTTSFHHSLQFTLGIIELVRSEYPLERVSHFESRLASLDALHNVDFPWMRAVIEGGLDSLPRSPCEDALEETIFNGENMGQVLENLKRLVGRYPPTALVCAAVHALRNKAMELERVGASNPQAKFHSLVKPGLRVLIRALPYTSVVLVHTLARDIERWSTTALVPRPIAIEAVNLLCDLCTNGGGCEGVELSVVKACLPYITTSSSSSSMEVSSEPFNSLRNHYQWYGDIQRRTMMMMMMTDDKVGSYFSMLERFQACASDMCHNVPLCLFKYVATAAGPRWYTNMVYKGAVHLNKHHHHHETQVESTTRKRRRGTRQQHNSHHIIDVPHAEMMGLALSVSSLAYIDYVVRLTRAIKRKRGANGSNVMVAHPLQAYVVYYASIVRGLAGSKGTVEQPKSKEQQVLGEFLKACVDRVVNREDDEDDERGQCNNTTPSRECALLFLRMVSNPTNGELLRGNHADADSLAKAIMVALCT